MKKPKCPYTFPHTSRRAKVDYLTDIGGYYSRHETFPLEFTVSAACADLDFDSLWEGLLEEHRHEFPDGSRKQDILKFCAKKVYDKEKDNLWEWAVEDACRSLHESDTYRMLWNGSKSLRVEFGLYGRGGKHLCLESFEGITLKGLNPESLGELLMTQNGPGGEDILDEPLLKPHFEWQVPTDRLNLLYRYVRQCEIDFTSANAEKEVEYQAAWHLGRMAEELYETMFGSSPDAVADKLIEDARNILSALPSLDTCLAASFTNLCIAAGIDLGEFAITE